MKKNNFKLLEEHLQSLEGMEMTETSDFFYSRLRARMEENKRDSALWKFPLRPAWVLGTLLCLLALNGVMLSQQWSRKKMLTGSNEKSLQRFAEAYDQTINTSY